MIEISEEGILNPKIKEMLKDNKGQDLRKEMLKIVSELYWSDSDESQILNSFINDFFDQYQPERSKREDFFLKKPNKEELVPLDMDDFLSFVK